MDVKFLKNYYVDTKHILDDLKIAKDALASAADRFHLAYSLQKGWPTKKTTGFFATTDVSVLEKWDEHKNAIKKISTMVDAHIELHQSDLRKVMEHKQFEDDEKEIQERSKEIAAQKKLEEESKKFTFTPEQMEIHREQARARIKQRRTLKAKKLDLTLDEYNQYKPYKKTMTPDEFFELQTQEELLKKKRQTKRLTVETKLEKELPKVSKCKEITTNFTNARPLSYNEYTTKRKCVHTRSCDCCLKYFDYLCGYFDMPIYTLEKYSMMTETALTRLRELMNPATCLQDGVDSADVYAFLEAQINDCKNCRSGIFEGTKE